MGSHLSNFFLRDDDPYQLAGIEKSKKCFWNGNIRTQKIGSEIMSDWWDQPPGYVHTYYLTSLLFFKSLISPPQSLKKCEPVVQYSFLLSQRKSIFFLYKSDLYSMSRNLGCNLETEPLYLYIGCSTQYQRNHKLQLLAKWGFLKGSVKEAIPRNSP